MTVRIGFKTSPQDVDWATIDATWRRAGELTAEPGGGFDSGWMNDHLTNMDPAAPGGSLEALTLLATLVHHVPGVLVGHGVLANTFRHPVILAKAAVVLDHATSGRFVLGLGAGWFEGEHEPFGLELPPIGPRIEGGASSLRKSPIQRSPAVHPGRSADLPGRPGAARDPAGGPSRLGLAASRHPRRECRVLLGEAG